MKLNLNIFARLYRIFWGSFAGIVLINGIINFSQKNYIVALFFFIMFLFSIVILLQDSLIDKQNKLIIEQQESMEEILRVLRLQKFKIFHLKKDLEREKQEKN